MSQISGTALDAALRPAPASRFSELNSEDFVKIIFTELTNQDPFAPNDSGALLEQLNSIRSIESDLQLTQKLESIVFQNQLSAASTMIGNAVEGLNANGHPVDGIVVGVLRQDNEISLRLDTGWEVPVENILSVIHPLALSAPPELPLGGAA